MRAWMSGEEAGRDGVNRRMRSDIRCIGQSSNACRSTDGWMRECRTHCALQRLCILAGQLSFSILKSGITQLCTAARTTSAAMSGRHPWTFAHLLEVPVI